jgi:hypothetical protein
LDIKDKDVRISYYNDNEAKIVVDLVLYLTAKLPVEKHKKITIITRYKA